MPATPAIDLYLVEIFSSIQGEGVLIGRRQLFVRFADCNLGCAYCDTGHAAGSTWSVEAVPGELQTVERPNPVSPQFLSEVLNDWQRRWPLHHSLALTGGEPLVQAAALAAWLPEASRILPVHLETNGTLPDALQLVLSQLTWISMDIKLASSTGQTTPWAAHEDFLARAGEKLCQVKAVVDPRTTVDEIAATARLVERYGAGIPLILQPRTVAGHPAVTGAHLLSLQSVAAREHRETLVIPQVHPLLAMR